MEELAGSFPSRPPRTTWCGYETCVLRETAKPQVRPDLSQPSQGFFSTLL